MTGNPPRIAKEKIRDSFLHVLYEERKKQAQKMADFEDRMQRAFSPDMPQPQKDTILESARHGEQEGMDKYNKLISLFETLDLNDKAAGYVAILQRQSDKELTYKFYVGTEHDELSYEYIHISVEGQGTTLVPVRPSPDGILEVYIGQEITYYGPHDSIGGVDVVLDIY